MNWYQVKANDGRKFFPSLLFLVLGVQVPTVTPGFLSLFETICMGCWRGRLSPYGGLYRVAYTAAFRVNEKHKKVVR